MLDVRRLRVLREVATTGSVTGAAANLGYTHSAISQHLHALERETGTPLIERNGRTIRLTHAAEVLVGHAQIVLAHLERAEADLAASRGGVGGEVRLASFATALRRLLREPLTALRSQYPDLDVQLFEMEPEESLPSLVQRRVDIVLGHGYDLVARPDIPDLHEVELLREPVLFVRPASDDGATGAVELADHADRPWIVPYADTACGLLVERACAAVGFAPHAVARTREFTTASALVAAGLGVTLMPELGLQPHRGVVASPVRAPALRRRVYLATRKGSETHPAIAAVLTGIQERARRSG